MGAGRLHGIAGPDRARRRRSRRRAQGESGAGRGHVLGIALEQIAQLELADGRHHAAIEAGRECLALHEAVGYTEGTVAALHVLAHSHAAAGDAKEARALHLRALGLATRIGHVAAVCEGLEGLAALAATEAELLEGMRFVEVARRERDEHSLPLRARDRHRLDRLHAIVEKTVGPDAIARVRAATARTPTDEVLAQLLA